MKVFQWQNKQYTDIHHYCDKLAKLYNIHFAIVSLFHSTQICKPHQVE